MDGLFLSRTAVQDHVRVQCVDLRETDGTVYQLADFTNSVHFLFSFPAFYHAAETHRQLVCEQNVVTLDIIVSDVEILTNVLRMHDLRNEQMSFIQRKFILHPDLSITNLPKQLNPIGYLLRLGRQIGNRAYTPLMILPLTDNHHHIILMETKILTVLKISICSLRYLRPQTLQVRTDILVG